MKRAVRMEWTKLRTVRGTAWCLVTLVLGTAVVGALVAATGDAADCRPRPCTLDAVRISLTGIYCGQLGVVVLAALAVTAEYDTMLIRTTLAASPRRIAVLAAKATVVAATVLAAGLVAVAASAAAGRIILPGNGFTPEHGYPHLLSPADGPAARAYLGTVGYLGLIALLSLGIAATVRHTGAAVTVTLALLYVAPIAAQFTTDPVWQQRILRYTPMPAGLAVQATVNLDTQPIGPWTGLGVLAAYTGTAVVLGALLLHSRDA